MKAKNKLCDGCKEPRPIWKNVVEDGRRLRLCRTCWGCHKPKHKPTRKSRPRPVSKKRQIESKEYSRLRLEFLTKYPNCQAALPGCLRSATEVHHKKGRVGVLYLDMSKWLATCHNCHVYIELHPQEAINLGLSLPRSEL